MALSKIQAGSLASGAVSKGFSNITTYSANSSSNTIPTNADKLLFVIAGGGGGGSASFLAAGGNGGDSTVVYNSVTYTATGGQGALTVDGSTNYSDVARSHSAGTATGGLVITGGGSVGGGSGATIASGYSASPRQGPHGGMVVVQVDVVAGQTTYDVTVGAGGTAGTTTYGNDTATGAAGAGGYVLVYDNG